MNKYTILAIVIVLLAIGTGLGLWLTFEPATDVSDSIPSNGDSSEYPENTFTENDDCVFVCGLLGFKDGGCLKSEDAAEGYENISGCVIEGSQDCSAKDQCFCYCWGEKEKEDEAGLANPAAVFCEEQGGTLDPRQTAEGTSTYCIFDDGTECEEWAYFRGECPREETEDAEEE